MKLKLEDVKVRSFVTNEMVKMKGGGPPPTDENEECSYGCGGGASLLCYTNWCPSDWTECGYTDLC